MSSSRWSQKVTHESHAMDLEPGVFTMTPKRMAKSMKRSVESSDNLKSSPFRSGMSMLSFYQNRAGKKLPEERHKAIQEAKHEFRKLYKMADLGTVEEWLEKAAVPKGSPYTKRFGQKFTSKMTSTVGKIPNRGFRGKYTKLADLGSVNDWLKLAVGTGDDDYESPSGSYGNHKHVQGENECHLCKGQPILIVERNEKDDSSDKTGESHDSVEYHEILKIVAEAHGVDLTKPESIDLLPALLREADHVMMKHEKLETAEEEMGEQMMGQNERPQ